MQKKKERDNPKGLEEEPFCTESFESRLVTRRSALTTAGKVAIGVAAVAALSGTSGAAASVLGRGALMTASVKRQCGSILAKPASVGIFTYMMPSTLNVDISHETVTLPLFRGRTKEGKNIWYIVTESSDLTDATNRGVNYSNKMLNALGTKAVQEGYYDGDTLVFDGTVNFDLTRVLVPDPVNGFPPLKYAPGAMGDARYSPLVHLKSGGKDLVINAPQVANHTGVSDSVVDIDYGRRTVTLLVLAGFVDGQFNIYLRT